MRDGRQMREQTAQHTLLKRRASADHYALVQGPITNEEEVPDSYYPQRLPTSTRRYVDTRGNQVIQQGNKRIVIHDEPPPKKKSHWLLFTCIGMLAMVVLWFLLQLAGAWWTNQQLYAAYQYPRMSQADEVVGHSDSTDHPTHFIFENLRGQVIVIEFPGGNYTRARIYKGPTLYADNADQIPVTAEFKDVNGDGKVDIVLRIQDQRLVFYNTGTEFKEQ
jgi:hypothetical protein